LGVNKAMTVPDMPLQVVKHSLTVQVSSSQGIMRLPVGRSIRGDES
jgi:hypothetical protein